MKFEFQQLQENEEIENSQIFRRLYNITFVIEGAEKKKRLTRCQVLIRYAKPLAEWDIRYQTIFRTLS